MDFHYREELPACSHYGISDRLKGESWRKAWAHKVLHPFRKLFLRLSKLSWFKNYHNAIKWPISSAEPVILAKMSIYPPHLCDKLQKYKTQATLWTACAHDGGMSPNHLEMLADHRLSGAVSCRITFISHSVIHYIIQLIHWLLLLSLSLTMWSGPISFGLFF